MSDPNALPIAGWYPDPENEAGDRWWNGATWSEHRRPRNAPAGWAPAPAKRVSKKAAAAAAAEPAVAEPAVAEAATAEPVAPGAATAIPVPPIAPAAAARPNPYAGTAQPAYQPAAPGAPYAQPYAQPYAPAYAPNYAPAQPMRNPLALGGMITSLVALVCNFILFGAPGIAGAIVSFFGLRRANKLAAEGIVVGNGKAMAITGIVAGLVGAFLWDLFYFTTFAPLSFS